MSVFTPFVGFTVWLLDSSVVGVEVVTSICAVDPESSFVLLDSSSISFSTSLDVSTLGRNEGGRVFSCEVPGRCVVY